MLMSVDAAMPACCSREKRASCYNYQVSKFRVDKVSIIHGYDVREVSRMSRLRTASAMHYVTNMRCRTKDATFFLDQASVDTYTEDI